MSGAQERTRDSAAPSKSYAKGAGIPGPLKRKGNFQPCPHPVRAPSKATRQQIEIGAALLEIETELTGAAARILAADLYREMIAARPPLATIRVPGLTPRQAVALYAIHDLAERLGYFPSLSQEAADRGIAKEVAGRTRRRLTQKGYIRVYPDGKIRALKPL